MEMMVLGKVIIYYMKNNRLRIKKPLNLKNALLLLTFLMMFSCNSNYNNAVEYYKNATNSNADNNF